MFIGTALGVGLGAATLGHDTDWAWVAAGVAIVAVGAVTMRHQRPEPGRRWRTSIPVIVVTLTVCFAVGASNSIIIDGRPVLATSHEAEAYRMVQRMEDDMMLLVEIDELLALSTTEARARSREITEMRPRAESLEARWANANLDSVPDGQFAPVAASLSAGSYAAVEALKRKEQLLGSTDAAVVAELNSLRTQLGNEVLSASPQLVAIGKLYDYHVTLGAPQERE